jgi:putative endonuclease
MQRQRLGRFGEWAALAWLLVRGYRLRDRNWRGGGGEIDLIVERRREIVFVEVKTRSSDLFGGAIAAVNRDKQRMLSRVSAAYLSAHRLWQQPCRFDIITVEQRRRFPFWRIRHYRNAFSPDRGRLL